jgi:hypothetical protein
MHDLSGDCETASHRGGFRCRRWRLRRTPVTGRHTPGFPEAAVKSARDRAGPSVANGQESDACALHRQDVLPRAALEDRGKDGEALPC